MDLFGPSLIALDAALGAAGQRQQVLANNLANVNTPGFKRSDVNFDGVLSKAYDEAMASGGDLDALRRVSSSPQVDNTSVMRADGNNVDIDNEMANLAENNVRYNALIQMATKEMSILKYVISGGSR